MTISIAHLVNPVYKPADPFLERAQQITFETMRVARDKSNSELSVQLLSAQYPEDHVVIPADLKTTIDLEESAASFQQFSNHRKLPLLKDLLHRLYTESDADYLIYTNVDIAVMPEFYNEVAKRIRQGYDAFIINRRRIPEEFAYSNNLEEMYSHRGLAHPGFDCFIFHRSLYPKFNLANVCIGIPFVEITFSQNLFCYANRFRLFDKEHLTFHLGMEIFKKRDKEYLNYNRNEYRKALNAIRSDLSNRKFPWGDRNFFYRFIRWGLHPAIPIRLALSLESQRWKNK
ncbi:MAG: hypothetical protein ACXWV4_05345 [Flavitalea sp.]